MRSVIILLAVFVAYASGFRSNYSTADFANMPCDTFDTAKIFSCANTAETLDCTSACDPFMAINATDDWVYQVCENVVDLGKFPISNKTGDLIFFHRPGLRELHCE
jgi:hypothetical protein